MSVGAELAFSQGSVTTALTFCWLICHVAKTVIKSHITIKGSCRRSGP